MLYMERWFGKWKQETGILDYRECNMAHKNENKGMKLKK